MSKLHQLFKPLQPSIDYSSISEVVYKEVPPTPALAPFVHCYWQLSTTTKLATPFMYRVVSDGCIDILFEQSQSERPFITGFSTKYLEYELGQSFDYLGIRFLPTGFPALFDISADSLVNQFIELSQVASSFSSQLVTACKGHLNINQAKTIFDRLLSTTIADRQTVPQVDPRLLKAMDEILEARGNINLQALDVGVSERQLRRLFKHYFGETPKAFAKIIRFQNILNAKPSTQSLKENKIFYDEGYYDQAHFIKEFKAFYGVTPSRAFGR